MTFYNESDDYFKGFIVGSLTVITIFLPLIIMVSIIDYLPSFYRELFLIILVFSLPFWLIRAIKKIERFIKTKLNKANPKFTNPIISMKKEES